MVFPDRARPHRVGAQSWSLCRLLWEIWSPHWSFDDATFERSAVSFANGDFVAVTIHSYRHRYGNAAGDPELEAIERRLAAKPKINVPTIALQGDSDGVLPSEFQKSTRRSFQGRTSAICWRGSVTTRLRKRRGNSPARFSN